MKKSCLLFFGGPSPEHEISVLSARNILHSIDRDFFDIFIVGMDSNKVCYSISEDVFLNEEFNMVDNLTPNKRSVAHLLKLDNGTFLFNNSGKKRLDIVLPIFHGFGEDGTIQGFLEVLDVPYIGCGVFSSAVAMDKLIFKKLLSCHDLPIVPYIEYRQGDNLKFIDIINKLGNSFFIKPYNLGSSVGVFKIETEEEFYKKLKISLEFSDILLIEKNIIGRELDCSVIGFSEPKVSCLVETKTDHSFYSYEAKYIDPNGAKYIVQPKVEEFIVKQIQDLALKTYKILNAEGFARIDFFLSHDKKIFINEMNTIPGLRKNSTFPMMWNTSGKDFKSVLSYLIDEAFYVYNYQKKFKISHSFQKASEA